MIKAAYLFIIIIFEVAYLYLWRFCHGLKFISAISESDIALQLDDFIHNDSGSLFIIRIFHNKITLGFFELIKKYFLLWDFRIIVDLTSLFGLIGIIFALWILGSSKKSKLKIILIILFLPILCVFLPNYLYPLPLYILFITYSLLSLSGWWLFAQKSKTTVFQISFWGTLILSVCYFITFLNMIPYFCIK